MDYESAVSDAATTSSHLARHLQAAETLRYLQENYGDLALPTLENFTGCPCMFRTYLELLAIYYRCSENNSDEINPQRPVNKKTPHKK